MRIVLFSLVFCVVLAAGCPEASTLSSNDEPTIKKGVKPIPDNEIAVLEMEDGAAFGTIKIELYSNIAPKMVARFKELANERFYDGVAFHRISTDVIQSGDPNTKDNDPSNDGKGGSDKQDVEAEFSDLEFDSGIVGAARGPEFNSANSQFFIMRKRQANFDNRYTIFGKVIEGMNNVSTIAGAPVQGEKPVDGIVIKSIRIEPRK
ncbi:MAG: peptidylprolyl isomerase [Acidobacteriota bacterium]|nr:peptidylprolyl isomerase [Acidobacteriota bacterium]MDH3528537.1 peptidylprolyl isomerase [Acidobacteriota bacterium]